MKKLLTVNEFAKLHNVNKRTLHYYDEINLFKPAIIKENNYRYYTYEQNNIFEYIRFLKKLGLSIGEIKKYLNNINEQNFLELAKYKIDEIDKKILELNETKNILKERLENLNKYRNITNFEIFIEEYKTKYVDIIPFNNESELEDSYMYIKDFWGIETINKGVGSVIKVNSVLNKNFNYDGLFTFTNDHKKKKLDKGKYLVMVFRDTWDETPKYYEYLIDYINKNNIIVDSDFYEIGLNEIAIDDVKNYLTKIFIKIK